MQGFRNSRGFGLNGFQYPRVCTCARFVFRYPLPNTVLNDCCPDSDIYDTLNSMTTDMNTYCCKYCIQAVFNSARVHHNMPPRGAHNEPNSRTQDTTRKDVAHICEASDWEGQTLGTGILRDVWNLWWHRVVEVMHPDSEEGCVGVSHSPRRWHLARLTTANYGMTLHTRPKPGRTCCSRILLKHCTMSTRRSRVTFTSGDETDALCRCPSRYCARRVPEPGPFGPQGY